MSQFVKQNVPYPGQSVDERALKCHRFAFCLTEQNCSWLLSFPCSFLEYRMSLLTCTKPFIILNGLMHVSNDISERNIGNMRRTRATNNPESNNRIFESQNLFQQKWTTMQKLSHIAEAT
jgi:hypothetical protein